MLAKRGLSQSVLDEFVRMLDQFDEAVALGNDGRTAHVGATRELRTVSSEIFRTVRVVDGRDQQRFAEDGQLLGPGSVRVRCWAPRACYGVGRRDAGEHGG
jgi:hypothetical protein